MARRGGIKLPDASDVQQIGIQSDPGVRVPDTSGDLAGSLDVLSRGLNNAADHLQAAMARQQRQLDANSQAQGLLNYGHSTQTEYQRLQVEADPADPDVPKKYSEFLDAEINKTMEALPEGMSEQAKTDLRFRLLDQKQASEAQMGTLHINAGQAQSLDLIQQQVNVWGAQAYANPKHVDDVLYLANDGLAQFDGTMTADAERGAKKLARESIISASLNSLIDKGQLGAARDMLASDKYGKDITQSKREGYSNAIVAEQHRMETEARQRAAEAKQGYLEGYSDYVPYVANGGTPDGRYSRSDLVTHLGTEEGNRRADQVEIATKMGTNKNAVEFATPEEINGMLADAKSSITGGQPSAPMFVAGANPSGLLTPGNLDLTKRPTVHNADGSISTVRSITITDDAGKAILIPTVIGDKVVSNKDAVAHYRKTGENLGVFDTEDHADAYAQSLHEEQAAAYTGDPSANFRLKAASANDLAQAVADRNRRLLDDPALFVSAAPTVKEAYAQMQAATGDPNATPADRQKATAAYATAAEAEQARLGLRPDQTRLLTDAQVDDISGRFQQQATGGENAATLSASLADQWGSKWPQVYGELAKKLPSAAVVIGSGMPPAMGTKLAEAAKLGDKALKDMLPSDVPKQVHDNVASELAPLASTLSLQPGGAATYDTFASNIELLALKLATEGQDPASAARQAAETKTAQYSFRDTFRVPIAYDPDNIQNKARGALDRIDPAKLDLPTSLAGLPEADTRQQYYDAIRDKGFWVTNPDETGLTLYDETQSAVTSNGKPYTLTWQQLLALPSYGRTAPTSAP